MMIMRMMTLVMMVIVGYDEDDDDDDDCCFTIVANAGCGDAADVAALAVPATQLTVAAAVDY